MKTQVVNRVGCSCNICSHSCNRNRWRCLGPYRQSYVWFRKRSCPINLPADICSWASFNIKSCNNFSIIVSLFRISYFAVVYDLLAWNDSRYKWGVAANIRGSGYRFPLSVPLICFLIVTILLGFVGCCHNVNGLSLGRYNLEGVTFANTAAIRCGSLDSEHVCTTEIVPRSSLHVAYISLVWSSIKWCFVTIFSHVETSVFCWKIFSDQIDVILVGKSERI